MLKGSDGLDRRRRSRGKTAAGSCRVSGSASRKMRLEVHQSNVVDFRAFEIEGRVKHSEPAHLDLAHLDDRSKQGLVRGLDRCLGFGRNRHLLKDRQVLRHGELHHPVVELVNRQGAGSGLEMDAACRRLQLGEDELSSCETCMATERVLLDRGEPADGICRFVAVDRSRGEEGRHGLIELARDREEEGDVVSTRVVGWEEDDHGWVTPKGGRRERIDEAEFERHPVVLEGQYAGPVKWATVLLTLVHVYSWSGNKRQ